MHDEFTKEEIGEARGVVADYAVLLQEVGGDVAQSHAFQFGERGLNDFRALGFVAAQDLRRSGRAVDHGAIKQARARVLVNRTHVVGNRVMLGLAGLGHKIRDVDALCVGMGDDVRDVFDEEIGNDAGVKRAGADKNQIGGAKRFENIGERADAARDQAYTANPLFRARDIRFAGDDGAIFQLGLEGHVLRGGRKYAAAYRKHARGDAHGFRKISGDIREGSYKKVSEAVAGEAASNGKAILKKFAEKVFVLRERNHAIADIARGKHAIVTAKTARTSAIVRNCDNSGEIGNGKADAFFFGSGDIFLEAAQNRGKAGAAAECDNADGPGTWVQTSFHRERRKLTARTVSLRVEQLGEARIFLQECEIFIVARMVTIFGPKLDRDF